MGLQNNISLVKCAVGGNINKGGKIVVGEKHQQRRENIKLMAYQLAIFVAIFISPLGYNGTSCIDCWAQMSLLNGYVQSFKEWNLFYSWNNFFVEIIFAVSFGIVFAGLNIFIFKKINLNSLISCSLILPYFLCIILMCGTISYGNFSFGLSQMFFPMIFTFLFLVVFIREKQINLKNNLKSNKE